MSYNLTTMQSIYHIEEATHYISPTAQAGFINFAPNYTARNTTKLEFVFVPGTFNGSAWVGHMGVVPDISYPDRFQDSNDFRLISYHNGNDTRLDVHSQEQNLSTRLNSSTPKLKVEMWDFGINIWDENGTLIETHTWTSGGTWDSGISIYGWPVKEEQSSGVIEVLEDFKLYSVKITDDTLGLIYDGVVNANGLYDSVSNSYTTITGWEIHSEVNKSEIVEITYNGSSVYQKSSGPDYTEPFYVENITNENETLNIVKSKDAAPTLEIEYSTDKTTWNTFGTTSTTALTRTLAPGDKVYLRCNTNEGWGSNGTNSYSNRISGCSKVGGNIMSLIYGSSFTGRETTFKNSTYQTFRSLFDSNNVLEDAQDLLLPATTLAARCYLYMFYRCTSLTTAPALPATTLADDCYSTMFYGCTSLTSAPALPATTLADDCYSTMFQGCTSLTTAPALPATTLAEFCYQSMFYGCTALTTAPALPVTTLADGCYSTMFYGCTSLTTAPALPATTLASFCYSEMFSGCTSLTTAPALPATTLAEFCYQSMFYGCTALTTAPALPVTTLADGCYSTMFYGCTSLTTAPALPATTLASFCYSEMFSGCTSLTTAPVLPAIMLTESCYVAMFRDCTSLDTVECLATDIDDFDATEDWLDNVSDTGTFTKASGVDWPTGESGIPRGWEVIEV